MPYIDIGDAQVWVEDTGGDGRPVVLLHAAAGNSTCWAEQRPMFEAAGYRVIAYDMRGFGETRSAADRRASGSMAGDLEALVEKMRLPEFSLVGTARGSVCALEYALDNPSSLKALVVSTSFGGFTDAEPAAVRARYVDADLLSLPTEERELGATYRSANPEGVHRFMEMTRGNDYKDDGSQQSVRTPLTLARVAQLTVPTLLVAGDEDRYAPPPVMKVFADRIPGAEFEVMQHTGHSAYWERPQEWNLVVQRFLRQHA
jgi:3-oxoadipate enol-lactonase